jgi:DNA-binding NarL/FixJ family response regulator
MPIRVAIVEDDPVTRKALALQINRASGLSIAGSYASAEEALSTMPGNLPDLVLMDINLPVRSGIECLVELKTAYPLLQILILTASEDSRQIFAALRAGASGYLLKGASRDELVAAIEDVHAGGSPMSAPIARKVVSYFHKIAKPSNDLENLTPREQDILSLLAQGNYYKEIATELGISSNTVRNHLHEIYNKLHVQSRTEAVLKFLKR